jgi:dihydroorotate dehydrogenase electron transfer subunit
LIPPRKGHFHPRVSRNEPVSETCRLIVLERPALFPDAEPGHFVSIRVTDAISPLLRRPFSIMDLSEGELTLLVKVVGAGSAVLAEKEPGERIDLIGPLGGSTFPRPLGGSAVLVAGGTGIAPMLFAARKWRGAELHLVYGAACAGEILEPIVGDGFAGIHFATLDGSLGYSGDVVSLCEKLVREGKVPRVYLASCGPKGMVSELDSRVGGAFEEHNTSLETIMACGVGACRGCTVPKRTASGISFASVCGDGTVFRAEEVAWEEWSE